MENEIYIYGDIGDGELTASAFIEKLHATPGDVALRVHSDGGNYIEALAIYNAIKRHDSHVVAHIDGMAASAATIILMAADHIVMPANGWFMIHEPYNMAGGTEDELRNKAQVVGQMRDDMIGVYAARTGMSRDDIANMMKRETWMSGVEAKSMGFVDEVADAIAIAARADGVAFNIRSACAVRMVVGREQEQKQGDAAMEDELKEARAALEEERARAKALEDELSALRATIAEMEDREAARAEAEEEAQIEEEIESADLPEPAQARLRQHRKHGANVAEMRDAIKAEARYVDEIKATIGKPAESPVTGFGGAPGGGDIASSAGRDGLWKATYDMYRAEGMSDEDARRLANKKA